jgi:hypothetical protein
MARKDKVSNGSKPAAAQDGPEALARTVAELKQQLGEQNEQLAALKAELALVASERDKLRRDFTALENMQIETVALGEGPYSPSEDTAQSIAPSIDDLMSTFTGGTGQHLASHATRSVDDDAGRNEDEYQELISPEMIVLGSRREQLRSGFQRFLILSGDRGQTRCPLDQELMTIGRSDSADIKVEGDFVSRIHARVLRIGMDSIIEDAGSRNGTRVNGDLVRRHVLKHGDVVRVGSASFRYVDSAVSADLPD